MRYRLTYDTHVSVSVVLDLEDDADALQEEKSQALIESHFNNQGFAFGDRAHQLTATASVDGASPSMIEREDGDDWTIIVNEEN